jgi:hypothetical protein
MNGIIHYKECDLDLKIDLDIFMIQNFVFGDDVFSILFSQNTGTLKC